MHFYMFFCLNLSQNMSMTAGKPAAAEESEEKKKELNNIC